MTTPIVEEEKTLVDDDYDSLSLTVHARDLTAASSACECLLGMLARSQEQQRYITIGNGYCPDGIDRPFPVSGPTLSNFFQEIHHMHRKVTLAGIILDADQCRALATVSSPDLEINLERCKLASDDMSSCQDAFIECLQHDRGPTELDRCLISNRILATALTGNTRVVKLRIACDSGDKTETMQADHSGMGILFRSLTEMHGLLELNLYDHYIMDDNWHILCESLKAHRTLTCLDLRYTHRLNTLPMIANKQKVQRTRGIADILQANTLLHTIKLYPFDRSPDRNESVNLRLEANRYRPRILAVKRAGPAGNRFHTALLGRALQPQSVRNKSNLIWMFLSENADVVAESIIGYSNSEL
jgi:hypothetical protein